MVSQWLKSVEKFTVQKNLTKKHLVRLGIFRPRIINKNNDIKDDQSFVARFSKNKVIIYFYTSYYDNFDGCIPSLNPLENFLTILGQILIDKELILNFTIFKIFISLQI